MNAEYGEFVGVSNLYYAPVTADTSSAYTAGTPVYLAPSGEVAGSPKVSTKSTYYDNAPANTFTTEAETEVKITIPNVPASRAATLLGKNYDATSGRVYDSGAANPPDMALGFRFDMGTTGDYRYFWYLKGTFSQTGAETGKSKTNDVDPQTYELTFTAIVTTHHWTVNSVTQAMKRVFGDTTDSAFSGATWFTQVQTPDTVSAPDAVALSSIVPADDATGVAVTADVVLTFNNKIASEAVTIISAAGVIVAAAKTWDATGRVLTVNPTASLSSSTVYIVSVAGVVDVYGQALVNEAKNFTTAS